MSVPANPALAELLAVRAERFWGADEHYLIVSHKFRPKTSTEGDLGLGLIGHVFLLSLDTGVFDYVLYVVHGGLF